MAAEIRGKREGAQLICQPDHYNRPTVHRTAFTAAQRDLSVNRD
jgi:hypothetical protein